MSAAQMYPISLAEDSCTEVGAAWEQICEALTAYGHMFLFTDFDGTLSDFTPVPSAAVIDDRSKTALRRLAQQRKVTVAVLSGRSAADVADRVGLRVIAGGDHGLEIRGPDFEFVVPGAESSRLQLSAICEEILQETRSIPGALVELKRFTASVHYRQADPSQLPLLLEHVQRCVAAAEFEIRNGHCVLEIRPRISWNKGDAVQWVLDRYHAIPEQAICLGDDETDEDMFRRVPGAINIRVKHGAAVQTTAHYCLTRNDVPTFLEGVVDAVHGVI